MSEFAQPTYSATSMRHVRTRPENIGVGVYLYCAFIFSYLVHLGSRVPALGLVRVDVVLAGCALLAMLFSPKNASAPKSLWTGGPAKWLLVLGAYIAVTWPFVEWPGSVIRHGIEPFSKAVIFFVLTVGLIKNKRQLLLLVLVVTFAQSIRVLEPLYLHVTQGYWGSTTSLGNWQSMDRLSGAPSDVINPNGLAYIIVTTMPFLHFVFARTSKVSAGVYCLLLPTFLYTLLLTNSRSGFVVLIVMMGVFAWQSRSRLLVGLGFFALLFVGMSSLSDLQVDRFRSIYSDSAAGSSTAEGRIEGVRQDFAVAMRNPIVGHGLGTSREANAHGRGYGQISHNLFTEVAQELGFIGLGIFLMYLWTSYQAGRRAAAKDNGGGGQIVTNVSKALVVTMTAGAVFALASYGLSEFYWYLWSGLGVAIARIAITTNETVQGGRRR